MTQCYEKPKLTVHGRVEELTQNSGSTTEQDFFIITGNPDTSIPTSGAAGGSRNFRQNNDGSGGGFED